MSTLRSKIVRLAHSRPDLRSHLLPLLAGDEARTAATSHVAAKDTLDFVTWALGTQQRVSLDRALAFLERHGVAQSVGTGETKRGQPVGEGELVEIQANNAPGDLLDLLQPHHLRRGRVIKVEGEDIVIQFEGSNETLRVPGGTTSGRASGVYRTSTVGESAGRHFEIVYLPANERKPTQVSIEVLQTYVERGLSGGEDRSENYFSGYIPSWKTSKDGNPYFMVWTQQRGGRPRTVSPAKGQIYYIGLVGRRPEIWKDEFAAMTSAAGMPLVASRKVRSSFLGAEAGMFLMAHPDWREEVEDSYDPETDSEYLAGVIDLVKNFGYSHEQPWVRNMRKIRDIAQELINEG